MGGHSLGDLVSEGEANERKGRKSSVEEKLAGRRER